MSNRLLGLLIIFGFILVGIGFYMYSFVTYTSTVVINTNIVDYKVELTHKKTLQALEETCEAEKCEVFNISPFEYDLKILKPGYRDYEEKINVERKEVKNITIILEKDTQLVSTDEESKGIIEPITTEDSNEIQESNDTNQRENTISSQQKAISIQEKIERIRKNKEFYSYFEFVNFGEIYFKENGKNLDLYFRDILANEKLVKSYNNTIDKDSIIVRQVYGDDNKIYIEYGSEKNLYDSVGNNLYKIQLKPEIIYVKNIFDGDVSFVTSKGSFIYSIATKQIEYFSMFDDFVYKDGNYIGILRSNDIRRKNNLNFEDNSGDLIILNNPETAQKRLLYEPNFDIKKILIQGNDVVLMDINGKEFNLENY